MAARKTTARRKTTAPEPEKCPECTGSGEITETVRVGARKKLDTAHRQTLVCGLCWGSGEAPTD